MKKHSTISRFFKTLAESGNLSTDSEDEKLRKSSLIVMSLPFAAAGLIWGILYFINGLLIPGLIPFNYGLLSLFSFIYFRKSKRYGFYRTSQIFLILILPFLLQLTLGGFIPSSAVIIWALISPLSAMVFYDTKRSLIWFVSYMALVIIAYFLNDLLPKYFNWGLTDQFINFIFLLNILAVSALIYIIQFYFVGSQARLKKDIEFKNKVLKEQSSKLKELDETKSRFFANISHEFRTPLTLILGLINKQMQNPELPVQAKDSKMIHGNANRLLQLINQLLDLSKLESGELKLQIVKDDISKFTNLIVALFESMAASKNIKLLFNGHPVTEHQDVAINVYFDREKLNKILTNLISNAVKFTPTNGDIAIKTSTTDDNVVIEISNSGKEIPADQLPLIFDRFYQVDTASTREYEGTGIGLALVKELISLHEGEVSVTSSPLKTTFTITLPLSPSYLSDHEIIVDQIDEQTDNVILDKNEIDHALSTIISNENLDPIMSNSSDDQLEVLVVEDNSDLRDYIKSVLDTNYKVIEAVDGVDGLQKAEHSIPDLIVSDVMMPNMDGYELCREIKSNQKTNHIPVILLTAKASREDKLEGLQYGADDYLIKPFDEEELRVRIKNLIAIREQLQLKYKNEVWLPKEVKADSVHHVFLDHVKEAIEKNIDNDQFSVDDLGLEIAMSRSQVHRKLKALTDQSATTFIRNYRLYRAAELIKQNAGNITEIAYQVGFSSQTYFSSCFHELFGCAPSAFKDMDAR